MLMKKLYFTALLACVLFSAHAQPQLQTKEDQSNLSAEKSVVVYTTADKTDLRLSPQGTLAFKPYKQPFETEICVFIDPAKTFQSVIGIGGSLTDASAETFAKISQE